MELIKVVLLGIIVSILAMFLKNIKPEYSIITLIVGGAIILLYILNSMLGIFGFFDEVVNKTGINNDLFITMLKIVGIGYLVEFSANICKDSGNSSIADKVVLAGKLMIFIVSMPIIRNLFNMVMDLIQWFLKN